MLFILYATAAIAFAFIVYLLVSIICICTMASGPDWITPVAILGGVTLYVVIMIYFTGEYQDWAYSQ